MRYTYTIDDHNCTHIHDAGEGALPEVRALINKLFPNAVTRTNRKTGVSEVWAEGRTAGVPPVATYAPVKGSRDKATVTVSRQRTKKSRKSGGRK